MEQQVFLQYHDPSRRRILVLSPYKLIIKRTVLLLIITGCLQWANPLGQCGIYTSDVTKGDKRRKTFPDICLQLCNLAEQTAPAHIIGSLEAAAELISWPRICGAARAINNYITMRGYPGINWKLVPTPIWDPDNLQCLDAGFGWRRSRVEKQSPHQNTVVGQCRSHAWKIKYTLTCCNALCAASDFFAEKEPKGWALPPLWE